MKSEMIKISQKIECYFSLPLMIFLLTGVLIFFWIFNVSSLPLSNPELITISGEKGLLDLMTYYSAGEAYEAVHSYGEKGRELYFRFIAADYLFIIFYSIGFSFLLIYLIRFLPFRNKNLSVLNLLPFSVGLFDFIENTAVLSMLAIFPDKTLFAGTIAGTATFIKHLLSFVSVFVLAVSLLLIFYSRLKHQILNSKN
ncbi:MAG: hypothetical protein OEZ34_02330 [Spirochaetia bacterium]|nr:hypothetical protein [Spirochaetia bacterium]